MSSRLLDIARKFNVFYLNGKFRSEVFVLIPQRNFSLFCNEKKTSNLHLPFNHSCAQVDLKSSA